MPEYHSKCSKYFSSTTAWSLLFHSSIASSTMLCNERQSSAASGRSHLVRVLTRDMQDSASCHYRIRATSTYRCSTALSWASRSRPLRAPFPTRSYCSPSSPSDWVRSSCEGQKAFHRWIWCTARWRAFQYTIHTDTRTFTLHIYELYLSEWIRSSL